MKNKSEDLRNLLFQTIEGLLADKNPLDINRAKAVAETAAVMVDLAKAETSYVAVTGAKQGSGFFPDNVIDGQPMKAITGGRK